MKASVTSHKNIFCAGLFAISLYGFYLRFYEVGAMSLWMDEAFSVRVAMNIREHGWSGDREGTMIYGWLPQHYLMAAFINDHQDVHVRARWPAVIAGTVVIFGCGSLTYLITGSLTAGLLAGSLVAFSVVDIAWSRQARGYALLQCFGMMAVLTGWRATHSKTIIWWLVTVALLMLAILTHRAGYVYWLMVAGLYITHAIKSRERTIAGLSVIVVLLAPLALGWLLPDPSSQGLKSTLDDLVVTPSKPSYAKAYGALIVNFWQWNLIWMLIGAVGLILKHFRTYAPILASMVIYLIVLSERTDMFHIRYLLPILPFLHMTVAYGPVVLVRGWPSGRPGRPACALIVAALFALTSLSQNLNLRPEAIYRLGPTEPQPDWRTAMEWVKKQDAGPTTIMAIPEFHDIYIGPQSGLKYFLPFSFTGKAGHWQETAPYAKAEKIGSFEDAKRTGGYIILDTFSLQRIKNSQIRSELLLRPPDFLSPDPWVAVWKLRTDP